MKKPVGRMIACVTVDVEDSDVESLLKIKETCRKHGASVTWFVLPDQCNKPSALELLQGFVQGGDEIGLHVHWPDSYSCGLRNIPLERIEEKLNEALQALQPRFSVKSFRGGGLCQTTSVLQLLERKGFQFDSSVACRLHENGGWHQGHENVCPVSAYYPAHTGYDVMSHDDARRSAILEIPVTRGIPSPKLWCNMLEPGLTPLFIMKLIFAQYSERRRFQPVVFSVLILHSWTWRKHPNTLRDLDQFLKYASNNGAEFATIQRAGHEWERIWGDSPELRESLLSYHSHFGLNSLLLSALFVYNLSINPLYYVRTAISKLRRGS